MSIKLVKLKTTNTFMETLITRRISVEAVYEGLSRAKKIVTTLTQQLHSSDVSYEMILKQMSTLELQIMKT